MWPAVASRALGRHPRHVALAAFAAGLVAAQDQSLAAALAAVAFGVVSLARRPALGLAAAGLLLAGSAVGVSRVHAIDRSHLGPFLGHAVTVRGHVIRRERPLSGSDRFRVRSTSLGRPAGGPGWKAIHELILVQTRPGVRHPLLRIGDEVKAGGVLERVEGRPGGQFDYAAYLRRAGIHAMLRADAVRATGRTRSGVAGRIDSLRRRAEAGVDAGLVAPLAALARGMVLGEDERVPGEMSDDFKASGLAHLLAVSGQNVTLLVVFALPVLAGLGLGRRARLAAVLALIAVYVPLTGAGPSILRAGAMGAAATAAMLAGRPASRWYGLLLAAAFTLVLDPRAWLDAGWQLSFAAVVGILVLVPRLRGPLHVLPGPVAEGAAVTLAATLATFPLMAFHFGRVSVVSLIANLVALPVVAPIMWLGMLAATIAQVWLAPAVLLNAVSGLCLSYLAAVARWSASLPVAVLPIRIGSPAALLATYAVLTALVPIARRARRTLMTIRCGPGVVSSTAAVVLLAGALLALSHGDARSPDRFTVTFLDVGQGDATLLQAPGGGAVLVDGGPRGDHVVEKLRKFGVRSLDVVVLTHPQADHEDGLEPVLRSFPVRLLVDGGRGSDAGMHSRLVSLARKRGALVRPGRAGETLRVGSLRLRVLSPDDSVSQGADVDPNDRAIVLLASYGRLDVFLPADAESNVTLGLPLEPIEVVKVAHHGSADAGLPALLESLKPRLAVIEVGAHNRYGHPAPSTLVALAHAVPKVLRTDRDGDVCVSLTGHDLAIVTRH